MKLIPKHLRADIWVKDRDINGNWGYRNFKTGLFRTTLPDSKEAKQKELTKRNNAVLKTYSANKARFDNSYESRRRNHSDETVKKVISKPIITSDKEGNINTGYANLLAPGEDSTQLNTFIEELIPIFKGMKLAEGLGKLALSKMGLNELSHWARSSLLNEAASSLTNSISYNIANNLSAKEFTLGDNPILLLSYFKPTRRAWTTGKAEGNSATSYFFKQQPDLRFELVKDIEPRNYSIHFKTNLGTLSYGDKMQLFAKVANEIPEGNNISTWGSISKGGIHGIDRFGKDFGFKLTGTRQLTMKGSGEPINVGVYTKLDENTNKFLDTPNIPELTERTDYIARNIFNLRKKGWADTQLNFMDKDVSDLFKLYASLLSEINPSFNNPDYINNFKVFLHNKGYKAKLTDEEIAKIITDNYNLLKSSNAGLVKDKVFWNGSPTRYYQDYNNGVSVGKKVAITEAAPESFDGINNSFRTSPSDNLGIYFGRQPFYSYSTPKHYSGLLSHPYVEVGDTGYDMLPYLLNDINLVVENGKSKSLGKGTLEYNLEFKGNRPAFTSNDNSQFFTGEYRISPETLTKSLYPHPKALVKNASGKIVLKRSWSDPRIHYLITTPVGISLPFLNNTKNENNNK